VPSSSEGDEPTGDGTLAAPFPRPLPLARVLLEPSAVGERDLAIGFCRPLPLPRGLLESLAASDPVP